MDLSLTLPTIASAGVRLTEQYIEGLRLGLITAIADTMPVDLVGSVGGTSGHGQATVTPPCQINLQRTVHLRAVLISLVLEDRSTAETIPNL